MALLSVAAAPAAVCAQCSELNLAAPHVKQTALTLANEYYAARPPTLSAAQKKAAAEKAVRDYGHAQWSVLIRPNAIADGLNLSMGGDRFADAAKAARQLAVHMGEVARTDIQTGASASVSGSTSVAGKTDIPRILSWAIEHGAVQREDNGTSTTVSTSPYALLLLFKTEAIDLEGSPGAGTGDEAVVDSDDVFNRYRHLRRLGVAATLDLDESSSDGSGDFNADKLSAVTTSVRLIGDRSPRTSAFHEAWNRRGMGDKLREQAQKSRDLFRLTEPDAAAIKAFDELLVSGAELGPVGVAVRNALVASTAQMKAADSVDLVLQAELCARIVRPVASGAMSVGQDPEILVAAAARNMLLLSAIQAELEELWDAFNGQPVVTFRHTWNRSDEGTDYSDFVLAGDGRLPLPRDFALAPLTFLLNASVSVNHDPSKQQDTIRDYAISGSLEKSLRNPLRIGNEAESHQQMSLALTGRFDRQEDVDANIGVVQGKVTVPLVRGFSLVVALDYASRTETSSEDEVRVAAGVNFNGDTFASLDTLQSLLSGRQ